MALIFVLGGFSGFGPNLVSASFFFFHFRPLNFKMAVTLDLGRFRRFGPNLVTTSFFFFPFRGQGGPPWYGLLCYRGRGDGVPHHRLVNPRRRAFFFFSTSGARGHAVVRVTYSPRTASPSTSPETGKSEAAGFFFFFRRGRFRGSFFFFFFFQSSARLFFFSVFFATTPARPFFFFSV